eukprot:3997521-Amphidinium_carterae.1
MRLFELHQRAQWLPIRCRCHLVLQQLEIPYPCREQGQTSLALLLKVSSSHGRVVRLIVMLNIQYIFKILFVARSTWMYLKSMNLGEQGVKLI